MSETEQLLLDALKAALNNETVTWDGEIAPETWAELLRLSEIHKVLPMVYQAVYACPAAASIPGELLASCRSKVRRLVMLQTQKTQGFLPLLQALQQAGAAPLVVKGIVCRSLYPNPDHRMSSDEDLLIPPEQFPLCHRILTDMGLTTPDPEGSTYETPYAHPASGLYLEIHTSLFPPENKAYGNLNRFFRDASQRAVVQHGIPTLAPTDHLLYLILHAFKHFLHSGFGIRQVCDIVLYANAWGTEINWEELLERCRSVRAEHFAAGLFQIGEKHLTFSRERAHYPPHWQAIYVESLPLLQDILRAGIYGSADMSRQHSSTITLRAVDNQTANATQGILKSLFPGVKTLRQRYPYLQEKPWLLPVAWTERLIRYSKETRKNPANAPAASIRIGKERLALLQKYGIIDKK